MHTLLSPLLSPDSLTAEGSSWPGFCLPIESPDVLVSQMMRLRGSSEKKSPSLLLHCPKPSPASARLDSPESPDSQGICKMYVNHPVCTSICTSGVITCRISLIPESKHGDLWPTQPRLRLFPEWHTTLLLDMWMHLCCEPCQNLGSKMSLCLCEAQRQVQMWWHGRKPQGSSGSYCFQTPHPKQRTGYPDFYPSDAH